MPMVDGTYGLPTSQSAQRSPIAAAFSSLVNAVWNVTAYQHDRDRLKAEIWSRRAAAAAEELRQLIDAGYGEEESELAVRAAVKLAREKFSHDLSRETPTYSTLASTCEGYGAEGIGGWRDRLGSLFGFWQSR